MKNATLLLGEQPALSIKKILIWFCLVTGLAINAWSQASLNPALPSNAKICTGVNASFSVLATASGTITYRWQESKDGGITWNDVIENTTTGANPANGIYTGTTGPVLTITRAPSTMNGNKYQSIVSVNGLNPVTSHAATLNVGPDVSLDDATSTNCPGTSNTLNTAAAAGVSYQWQVSSNTGSSWANITDGADATGVSYTGGATGSLTISPLTTSIDGYLYRYIANDGSGCVITSGATTQLVPTLAVFTLPAAGTISAAVGSSVSIPATITAGTGPLKYQWQVAVGAGSYSNISTSNTLYSGVTTSTLTIPSVTSAIYTNRYRVIVRNAGNCVTSNASFATVGLSVPLPVKLETFTAQKETGPAVGLSWTVDGQYPAQSYTVQKSATGSNFTDLGWVRGETGKTLYSWKDDKPGEGILQYRIKMMDLDGVPTYSTIVNIEGDGGAGSIGIRPSVSTEGTTNLYTALDRSQSIVLKVTDVTGRMLWSQTLQVGKGAIYTPIDISRLSKGMYYVQVSSLDGISKTLPLVKN